ncbi:MAG: ROK family protein, partial [Chloroflexi bacterium]|nr:ROK family protein [Chloroflexota bacterium]
MWGGVEAGGTKFVCAVGSGPEDLRAEVRFPTTTPDETLGRVIQYFRERQAEEPPRAIGVASFGPVDLDPGSPTYGYITTTPKPGWIDADVVGTLRGALGIPVGFDTDVNGAALGEHRWGAGRGLDTLVYLTVGTGIGGGAMVGGKLLHGLLHPEMGHIYVPRDWSRDPYPGCCPYHGDCWQGLAAGPALEERWGQPGETLPADHPGWALEADYLAYGLVSIICVLSPQRVILGGGLMQRPHLFLLVRQRVQRMLNGYLAVPAILDRIDEYIVPPALGNRSGVLGAIALAQEAGWVA